MDIQSIWIYKVWDQKRIKKICVIIRKNVDIYETVILEASKKLDIDGSSLCLEKDGTIIQEDEEIQYFSNEVLILLKKDEQWIPNNTLYTEIITVPNALSETDSSTITYCSDTVQDSENTENINFNSLWENFDIPWSKLPKCVLSELDMGTRKSSVISRVVNLVVEELREIKTTIPVSVFKMIAKKMVNKYPKSLMDIDEDEKLFGDGTGSLVEKCVDRNNYLNRPHKKNLSPHSHPQIKRRKLLAARAGCSDWDGNDSSNTSDEDNSENADLNQLDDATLDMKDDISLHQYLSKHYSQQRSFFNREATPTVLDIKNTWPIFTNSAKFIALHFKKLTKTNLDNFTKNLETKVDRLISYGLKNNLLKQNDKQKERCHQALMVFGNYFKEDLSFIFYKFKEDTQDSDITKKIFLKECCVVEIGSESWVFYQKERFIQCENFIEAVKIMVGLYFVLNLRYFSKVQVFFEFLQRYLLKIHPDSGCKSNALSVKRCRTLVNRLRKI